MKKAPKTEAATEPKKRYTPEPVPENSYATIVSPESPTGGRLRVMRFHNYNGKPWLFKVTDENDCQVGRWVPYEPNAIAFCLELERELAETDNDVQEAEARISLRKATERMNNG